MDTQAAQLLLDIGLIVVLVVVGVRLYRRRRRRAAARPQATQDAAPKARPISSRQEAEQAAAQHLIGLGFADVVPTADRGEGVDVAGRSVDAQVRWHAKPTDIAAVERLQRAARARTAVLYSFAGCTRSALKKADEEGVALFRLQVDGAAVPLNEAARALPDDPAA